MAKKHIPSMHLVKSQEDHSIARDARDKALKQVNERRANLAITGDYTDGSAIDCAVKVMIDKVVADRTIANGEWRMANG